MKIHSLPISLRDPELPIDIENQNESTLSPIVVFDECEEHQYNVSWIWIREKETQKEYKLYQEKLFSLADSIPSLILFLFILFTRNNLYDSTSDGPFFLCSVILLIVVATLYSIFLVNNGIIHYYGKSDSILSRLSKRLKVSWLGRNVEDILSISCTLIAGLILYARVSIGECTFSTGDIWHDQKCNPFARCNSIPTDQVIQVKLIFFEEYFVSYLLI